MRSSLALTVFALACLPPPPPHAAAHPPAERDAYGYTWNVPAAPAAAEDLTIAIVRPDWARESSISNQTHKAFAAGFSSSLAADLDKMLVAKGIKVSGPFPSYDDITYSDKKSAASRSRRRCFSRCPT